MNILRRVWGLCHHQNLLRQYRWNSGPRDQPIAGLYELEQTGEWVYIQEPPSPGQRLWKTSNRGSNSR